MSRKPITYHVLAYWQETAERDFESLDEAAAWVRDILGQHPTGYAQVAGGGFNGSWVTEATP